MTRLGGFRASPFRFSSVSFFLFQLLVVNQIVFSLFLFSCGFSPFPFYQKSFLAVKGEKYVNKQRLKKNHKTLISSTQCTAENIDDTKNLDGISSKICISGLSIQMDIVQKSEVNNETPRFFAGSLWQV